jgi:homoserine dehydrogenase
MSETVRTTVCGFGHVGRAFVRLVRHKRADVERRHGISLAVGAVVDLGGAAFREDTDLPLEGLARLSASGRPIESMPDFGRPGARALDVIRDVPADVLVEVTPTNLVDGEPGRSHMIAALDRGIDVVTANKGPLVVSPGELEAHAGGSGARLRISAATAAALPTLDVARLCAAGARILSIEGILNGTTNYILSRMDREGRSYEEALREAQDQGIAEADPSLDVDGLDTRSKLVLIASRLFERTLTLEDVDTVGITGITRAGIDDARRRDRVIKLIGSARLRGDELLLRVAPEALERSHPLAAVDFSEKGISFDTDTMGRITVTGGKSSPTGAAAALLKDIIHTRASALLQNA